MTSKQNLYPNTYKVKKTHKIAAQQAHGRSGRKSAAASALADNPHNAKLQHYHNPSSKQDVGVMNKAFQALQQRLTNKIDNQSERAAERAAKQTADREALLDKKRNGFDWEAKKDHDCVLTKDAAVAGRHWFFRDLKRLIDASDIILEVLDARDPLGCRCYEVERLIQAKAVESVNAASFGNSSSSSSDLSSSDKDTDLASKRLILVLNKIDLIPYDNLVAWTKRLRREFPTIAFKANTQQQQRGVKLAHSEVNVFKSSSNTSNVASVAAAATGKEDEDAKKAMSRSACVGGDALLQLLKNYSRSLNLKKSITVGIIGYPNVGKSSLINSMKRSRAVNVGATPGLTRSLQQVRLDKHISLIDSPGVIFDTRSAEDDDEADEAGLLLRNCVKVEQLQDPIAVVYAIVQRCTSSTLCSLYSLSAFTDATDFLTQVAMKRGKLKAGGVPDISTVARMVIRDWNNGIIPYHTDPPADGATSSSSSSSSTNVVVNQFAEEFDVSKLLQAAVLDKPDDDVANEGTSDGDEGLDEVTEQSKPVTLQDKLPAFHFDHELQHTDASSSSFSVATFRKLPVAPTVPKPDDTVVESSSSSSGSSVGSKLRAADAHNPQRNRELREQAKKEKDKERTWQRAQQGMVEETTAQQGFTSASFGSHAVTTASSSSTVVDDENVDM